MMKLCKKGVAILLLLTVFCYQIGSLAATESTAVENNISVEVMNRLRAFGIFDNYEEANDSMLTRGNMAKYIVLSTGYELDIMKGDTQTFTDVSPKSPAWQAVEAAVNLGIVKKNDTKMFYPDRTISLKEAVTMMVCAMRCEALAENRGGYPDGYMAVAYEKNLLKGVKSYKTLTKYDGALMIDNMLNANTTEITYNDKGQIQYSTNAKKTVLEDFFDVTKIKVKVDEVDTTKGTITVTVLEGENRDKKITYDVSNKVDLLKIGGNGWIYVDNRENTVVYVQLKKNSEVLYDYIQEVNKSDMNVEMRIEDIKNMYFKNTKSLYHMSDDAVIYYNDTLVTYEAYKYINCFAKIMVQDNEVIRMDIYQLKEGGLIYFAEKEEIRFTQGVELENYWNRLDEIKNKEIFIDGVPGKRLQDLKTDMIFDYWNDDTNKLVIVASSRMALGVLSTHAEDTITIDNEEYQLNKQFKYYNYNSQDQIYEIGGDYSKILGEKVTAIIDDNQTVRYIRIDAVNTNTNIVHGVVIKAYTDETTDEKFAKIYVVDGNKGETTYKFTEKFNSHSEKLSNGSLSFDYVASVASNLQGMGFFEFTLNNNSEIKKVDRVKYFGYTATQTETFDYSFWEVGGQFAGEAQIFSLTTVDGKFTVRNLDYVSQLMWAKPLNACTVVSDFEIRYNPVPNYIFLTTNANTIREVSMANSIIKTLEYKEDGEYLLEFLNGEAYTVSEQFVNDNNLKKNMLVEYHRRCLAKEPILIVNKRDLTGNSMNWATDKFKLDAVTGFFKAGDLLVRNDNIIQFTIDGEPTDVYKFQDDINGGKLKVYKHQRNSFELAPVDIGEVAPYIRPYQKFPVMNIRKGDNIWFHVAIDEPRTIDYIIYESKESNF